MTGTPHAHLAMQPVWATLGDYDNLLGLRMLIHTGSQRPAALHSNAFVAGEKALSAEEHAVVTTPGNIVSFSHYDGDFKAGKSGTFAVPYNGTSGEGAIWTGLAFAPAKDPQLPPAKPVLGAFSMADVLRLLMPEDSGKSLPDSVVLPGGADGASEGGFFHVDSEGHTCFSAAEAAKASRFIVESGVLERRADLDDLEQRKSHAVAIESYQLAAELKEQSETLRVQVR